MIKLRFELQQQHLVCWITANKEEMVKLSQLGGYKNNNNWSSVHEKSVFSMGEDEDNQMNKRTEG